MHFVTLPDACSDHAAAFADPASLRGWLKTLPQTQPLALLGALTEQTHAVDASLAPPGNVVSLLEGLRQAAIVSADALESRFLRKPLPLPNDDFQCFEAVQGFWSAQAIALLRRLPHLPQAQWLHPLHRATSALRLAQLAHFQAAQEIPARLDHLLLACLGYAEQAGCLRQPLADPAFPHLGEDSIAGHLAWAFMLRICDPYRLSAAQHTVANRALSRWRELAAFQSVVDSDTQPPVVDLAAFFLGEYPAGLPRWLALRKVQRKIGQRLEALTAGELPEALKLGRELSGAAAIRLLRQIAREFSSPADLTATEIGEIELAFGPDHAYALFTGQAINPGKSLEVGGATLAHQRVAMFGFDRVSALPNAVKRLDIPGEIWQLVDGIALRPKPDPANRRITPCLISTRNDDLAILGVLEGLREARDGSLSASLRWFDEPLEAVRLLLPGGREPVAAFLFGEGEHCSLLAPSNAGLRLEQTVRIEGGVAGSLVLLSVIERGSDFVRYAVRLP